MAYWQVREELSRADRLRRSYYELLRDDLDQFVLKYALTDSYNNFCDATRNYPFVEKRELKPRARIPDVEYDCQNAFLLIFLEDSLPGDCKKYIRFLDVNRTTKKNLLRSTSLNLEQNFDRTQKYLESVHFYDFLKSLLPLDFALLIQREPNSTKTRYILSHFHVRIDWPVVDATEDLAKSLRYISKDLYERGDRYAEEMQKKFFEYYGLPVMVGGRRTAAIVAAQFLKRVPCISTIYVGSSESRTLMRISERGVSKAALMRFSNKDLKEIAESASISLRSLKSNYAVVQEKRSSICIFQATYSWTSHARPPEDGKLREIKPDYHWLSVSGQHLLPKAGTEKYPPLPLNILYT